MIIMTLTIIIIFKLQHEGSETPYPNALVKLQAVHPLKGFYLAAEPPPRMPYTFRELVYHSHYKWYNPRL